MVKSGRNCTLTLDLDDKPGQLSLVTGVLGSLGANIISIVHERNTSSTQINGCMLRAEVETRSHQHVEDIKKGLRDAGFRLVE